MCTQCNNLRLVTGHICCTYNAARAKRCHLIFANSRAFLATCSTHHGTILSILMHICETYCTCVGVRIRGLSFLFFSFLLKLNFESEISCIRGMRTPVCISFARIAFSRPHKLTFSEVRLSLSLSLFPPAKSRSIERNCPRESRSIKFNF